ncbi:hypothetical protein [Nesterenkonia massiliensis]|uniref:hypothetical protein n=1 Tax=Nesterenkonia massiliensis TaxID=1232429 RepID=UPI0004214F6B|nr:hypothetical protein [Nesterenkonia massiliensis]
MTELDPTQQHVLDEARRVNEERMKAVEDLAAAVAHRVDLERQLNDAKKNEKRLMAAAEKAGWTRTQVSRFARPPKSTAKKAEPDNEAPQSEQSRPDYEMTHAPQQ